MEAASLPRAEIEHLFDDWLEARAARLRQLVKAGMNLYSGTGTPEGVVAAPIGSIYQRLDGGAATSLYVKESGAGTSTGWVAK